jgi:hypothetical protein
LENRERGNKGGGNLSALTLACSALSERRFRGRRLIKFDKASCSIITTKVEIKIYDRNKNYIVFLSALFLMHVMRIIAVDTEPPRL